jgi:hypothetical protein
VTADTEATQTDKRTAEVFLDTLSDIAYKEIKKNGEFVFRFWQTSKVEEEGAHEPYSKDATEDQDSSHQSGMSHRC